MDGLTGSAMKKRVILWLGALGPIGRMPASGTVAVIVAGVPLFAFTRGLALPVYLPLLLGFGLASVALHAAGDRILGEKDSRQLVWDELVGFLVAVTGVAFTWQTCVAAVIVERALDIAKVPPANWIERHVPGGWGVVGDDLVAGIYTCLLMHLLCRLVPEWMGIVT
jgi:phosphatidylglycerophosphatase A